MNALRALAAVVTFILGLIAFAGGLLVAATTFLIDIGHPLDVGAIIGGLVAMAVGLGFWRISRATGGDDGPIKGRRTPPRKQPS
ncbi:MAG TPA: hypothetical protein VGR57_06250 [Ktedonobacterales bacterium]|nr:hypothetical protein [Ktedonobacterales bacterium]